MDVSLSIDGSAILITVEGKYPLSSNQIQ